MFLILKACLKQWGKGKAYCWLLFYLCLTFFQTLYLLVFWIFIYFLGKSNSWLYMMPHDCSNYGLLYFLCGLLTFLFLKLKLAKEDCFSPQLHSHWFSYWSIIDIMFCEARCTAQWFDLCIHGIIVTTISLWRLLRALEWPKVINRYTADSQL